MGSSPFKTPSILKHNHQIVARWLLHHGAPEDLARKSIAFYRGPHTDTSTELRDIRLSLKGGNDLNILRQVRINSYWRSL